MGFSRIARPRPNHRLDIQLGRGFPRRLFCAHGSDGRGALRLAVGRGRDNVLRQLRLGIIHHRHRDGRLRMRDRGAKRARRYQGHMPQHSKRIFRRESVQHRTHPALSVLHQPAGIFRHRQHQCLKRDWHDRCRDFTEHSRLCVQREPYRAAVRGDYDGICRD